MTLCLPSVPSSSRPRRLPLVLHAACGLLAVFACSVSARAQTITSVDPPQGATGTQLIIEGSGFGSEFVGDKQPRVWLVSAEGKKLKLKVGPFQDDEIRATLTRKKVLPASYTVQVLVPGGSGAAASAPDAFEVLPPQLSGTDKPVAFAGSAAEIWGDFLGTKPGRVWVGDRKAKVLSWSYAAGSPFKGGQAQDRVLVAVHPKLEAGVHDLRVKNGTGEVVLDDVFTVLNHGAKCKPGKPGASARLDGDGIPSKFRSKPDFTFWAPIEFDPDNPFNESPGSATVPSQEVVGAVLARVLESRGSAEGGTQTFATFLGAKVSLGKKTARMVGLVVPDWDLDVGTAIDGAAMALGPEAFYVEARFQLAEGVVTVTSLSFWVGPATAADIVINGDDSVGATFEADELTLVEGDGFGTGPATVGLSDAVICNAYVGSL